MEATLRRWEDKFGGDETDKQEDKEEAVVSETVERKEDEQFKDDTRTDQLELSINMQEKVKSLETQLSEQKAELDVLREVVLDLCVSLGLESILLLITFFCLCANFIFFCILYGTSLTFLFSNSVIIPGDQTNSC